MNVKWNRGSGLRTHRDSKLNQPIADRAFIPWLPAALIGFSIMAALQTRSPHITGNDGYYHVKMAELLPELGFTRTFPWLRWTILNENFVSHHYGFHVLLLPFVALAKSLGYEAAFGGKLACGIAMLATFAVFDHILRKRGTPFPLFWALLLTLVPWHFWLRMTYVRAPMAALPLLLLALHWSIQGRIWLMLVLAFIFTQVYGGAVIFPLIPIGFLLAALVTREEPGRAVWQLAASGAGILLGLVISPYFPANFSFFYTQIFESGLGADKGSEVGGEWKSYDAWAFFQQAAPLMLIWFTCLAYRLRSGIAATRAELAMLFVNLAFFVLTLKSRRFVEYWPVFAMVSAAEFAAVVWRAHAATGEQKITIPTRIGVIILTCVGGLLSMRQVWFDQRPSHDVVSIQNAMTFLKANSPAGSMIFTDDWDIFPICFYFNHHNTYGVGLDPEFTRTRYPALWERYKKITRGEVPASLPQKLRREGETPEIHYEDISTFFGATYVLVADDHARLYRALSDRPQSFRQVYPGVGDEQPSITLFKILEKIP